MDLGDAGREEDERRDADDEADLLPLHRRLGLWCAMFPGCGALLVGLMILGSALVLRLRAARTA